MKQKIWNYFILCARLLLAWTFLSYGWGKLSGQQFGLSSEQLAKPVEEIGLFKLSWYLFDQEPFKSFIGISQIITALLLLYNRTLIIGALMAIPILANILIIDITYIKMTGFYWRLGYYLLLDFAILYHHRQILVPVLKKLANIKVIKREFPLWAYLILPIMVIVTEFLVLIPKLIAGFITNPSHTWQGLKETAIWLIGLFNN